MQFDNREFSKRYPTVFCAVFVIHEPASYQFIGNGSRQKQAPLPYRGTAAAIVLPDGRLWAGVTLCSPSEQFVRSTGRLKAIARAYQAMQTPNMRERGTFTIAHGQLTIRDGSDGIKLMHDELRACLQVQIDDAKRRALTAAETLKLVKDRRRA